MRRNVIILLIFFLALGQIFSADVQTFLNMGTSFEKERVGLCLDGEVEVITKPQSVLMYYANFGMGFDFKTNEEQPEFAEKGLIANLSGGIQYRLYRNIFAQGGLNFEGFVNLTGSNTEFLFRAVEADIAAMLNNGSLGIKGGALIGYNFKDEKAFAFKPYIKAMIGFGGNSVYRYNGETGEMANSGMVADDLKVVSLGIKLQTFPSKDKKDKGIMFFANGDFDWYFRFDSPDVRIAPLAGVSVGLGYGKMALGIDCQGYAGMGLRLADSLIFNLAAGGGFSLGYLNGIGDSDEQETLFISYFGWLLPSGYELDAFLSPSVTYYNTGFIMGLKAGCDIGYSKWTNAFGWTQKSNSVKEDGKGFFLRPYISISL